MGTTDIAPPFIEMMGIQPIEDTDEHSLLPLLPRTLGFIPQCDAVFHELLGTIMACMGRRKYYLNWNPRDPNEFRKSVSSFERA